MNVTPGAFFTNDTFTSVYSFKRYELLGAQYGIAMPWLTRSGFNRFLASIRPDMNLVDIQCMLLYTHEQQHFRQHGYTPYGLLKWRLLNTIEDDVSYLFMFLNMNHMIECAQLPIHKWWLEEGPAQLKKIPLLQLPLRFKLLAKQERLSFQAPQIRYSIVEYFNQLACEITILGEFLDLLEASGAEVENCTAQCYIKTANKAMVILRDRALLPNQIVFATKLLDSNSKVFPRPLFRTEDILEADSKTTELTFILGLSRMANEAESTRHIRQCEAIRHEWFAKNLGFDDPGDPAYSYTKVFQNVFQRAQRSDLSSMIYFMALFGEIDVKCSWGGVRCLEDVLPQWRLPRLYLACEKILKAQPEMASQDVVALAMRHFGWPSPEDTLRNLLNGELAHPDTWTGSANRQVANDNLDRSNIIVLSDYTKFREERFRKNFEFLQMDVLGKMYQIDDRPLLEVFSDIFVYNYRSYGIPKGDRMYDLLFSAINKNILSECNWQLYTGEGDLEAFHLSYDPIIKTLGLTGESAGKLPFASDGVKQLKDMYGDKVVALLSRYN